jgi:hypothetical protein
MGLKQCDKCSEMVDEAKAFCPGCGNAFVEEEKRQEASKFEKLDPTVQFGKTMYSQMLEDMGLNIGAVPTPVEKRVETIAPIKTERAVPAKPQENAVIETPPTRPAKAPEERVTTGPVKKSNAKWYILIGLAVLVLLPIALASTIFLVLQIVARLR